MRVMVLFDLPTDTSVDRHKYSNTCLTEFFNTVYSCGINIIDIEHTVPEIKLNSADMVIIDKDLCIVDK